MTSVTCADCHLGGQDWTTTCNGCHGQAGDPRGAPPADVHGSTAVSAVGVGAHRRHVDASAVSAPLDCVFCHEKPADAYDAGHLDGAVTVTSYRGADAAWIAAGRDPGWSRATATCASSYCHSAYAPANVPVWTAPRANACGTCHDLPPGGSHPAVGEDLHGCNVCHPDSMTADGQVKPAPAGAHLDGRVTVMGGHVAGWMTPESPEFHAFSADRGLAACQGCHGADLAGGFVGVACATCHGESWKTSCRMCHGDKADPGATGAPPRTIWGYGSDAVRTGGHGAHVNGSAVFGRIECGVCHTKPADAFSAGHVDAVTGTAVPTASVAFTGLATTRGTGSTWNRATPTCSVYCHGAAFAATSAGTNTTPSWTGGASEASCGTCHGTPPGGAHPSNSQCGSCHAGYTRTSVNLATHLDGTVEPPTLDCFSCHGDRARAPTTKNPQLPAAPPVGTNGETVTTSRGVGAHQLHLVGGTLSDGVACTECHAVPTAFGAGTGHPSGDVELSWGSLAGASSTWNAATFTCAATYCHGNFAFGNATYAPTWTNPAADACGTCHGNPAATATALPRTGHPALAATATNTACAACHPETVDASGAIVEGGKHVDGQPQTAAAASHPAGWILRTQHGAAAAQDGSACLACHAAVPPATVAARTCSDCHGGPGWTKTCNTCHGRVADPRGAPPADLAGNTAVTAIGVGAHSRHVDASPASGAIDCVFCHVKPADVFDAGHLDGGATSVTAYTGADEAWIAASRDPGWNAGTASCATSYCHSAYAPTNVPIWTAPRADACGTCHGLPPGGAHPAVSEDLRGCNACHPDSITAEGTVVPAPAGAHLDGRISVMSSHSSGWMTPASPEFHAFSADRGLAACQGCHGADLAGGFVGVACATCHGASWKTGCTLCHGGAANATGAPPKAIWGQGADAVRVGGHTAHVSGSAVLGPIDCGVCHVKPADPFSPGHIDAVTGTAVPTASVAFTGIAVTDGAGSTWDRATPTCSVYCHGATFSATSAGTNTTPSWTGGVAEATCGTCHGTPPLGTHPANTQCGSCHLGYTATSVNLATHIDGTVEAPTLDCFSCHGDRARAATATNPQLPAAPPFGTSGETAITDRAVGAHQLHLVGGTVSAGFACEECHVVPTDFGAGTGHPSGAVELKAVLGGTGSWNPADLTCSATYCHGNFRLGNAGNAPTWTSPAVNACGTCHGLPPGGTHPQNTECERCHPGYTGTSVNLATHVNGQLDANLTCTSCHGDASRTSALPTCPTSSPLCVDANLKVAPPVTATGGSAGAHLAHVSPAVLRSRPAQCEECHSGKIPTSIAHASSTIDVAFGGRAVTGGASPAYDAATGCSATYCHGNYSGMYNYMRLGLGLRGEERCALPRSWSMRARRPR